MISYFAFSQTGDHLLKLQGSAMNVYETPQEAASELLRNGGVGLSMDLYRDVRSILPYLRELSDVRVIAKTSLDFMGIICRAEGEMLLSLVDLTNMCESEEVLESVTGISVDSEEGLCAAMQRYVKIIYDNNPELNGDEVGTIVYTANGLERCIARRKYNRDYFRFRKECSENKLETLNEYRFTTGCVHGGLAFVNKSYVNIVHKDAIGLDMCSAYHAAVRGLCRPNGFKASTRKVIQRMANEVCNTSVKTYLSRYYRPFKFAFHAEIEFENLVVKGEIATIPVSWFFGDEVGRDVNQYLAECKKNIGAVSKVGKVSVMFSKVERCEKCTLFLNEMELWSIAQFYTWDNMRVLGGYVATDFLPPSAYLRKRSERLWDEKMRLKEKAKESELDYAYYQFVFKPQLNGIYGSLLTDQIRPSLVLNEDNNAYIGQPVLTAENFRELSNGYNPETCCAWGQRIASHTKCALTIAMLLLDSAGARVICGDTDSIKVANVTKFAAIETLEPLHEAIRKATKHDTVGCFEVDAEYDVFLCNRTKGYIGIVDSKVDMACTFAMKEIREYAQVVYDSTLNLRKAAKAVFGFDVEIPGIYDKTTHVRCHEENGWQILSKYKKPSFIATPTSLIHNRLNQLWLEKYGVSL